MADKNISYSKVNVYSNLLERNVCLELQQIIENEESLDMVTHDSLNRLANENKVKYQYSLKACSLEHAVVECEASLNGCTVIGIGETLTSTLSGMAKNIPTQMAYKRAFDAAIISLFQLPAKIYSEIQLNKEEITTPEFIMPATEEYTSMNMASVTPVEDMSEGVSFDESFVVPENTKNVENVPNVENVSDTENVENAENKEIEKIGNTPVLFSKALEGQIFRDVEPGDEWKEWLYADATEAMMHKKSKEVYDNYTLFKKYLMNKQ